MALSRRAKEAEEVPYYEVLKSILEVDSELDTISVRKILGHKDCS